MYWKFQDGFRQLFLVASPAGITPQSCPIILALMPMKYSIIKQGQDHEAIPDLVGSEGIAEAPFIWLKIGVICHCRLE